MRLVIASFILSVWLYVPKINATPTSIPIKQRILEEANTKAPKLCFDIPGGQIGLGVGLQLLSEKQWFDDSTNDTISAYSKWRRIRVKLKGSFFDKRLFFKLQFNLASSAAELIDAWVGYQFYSHLLLKVGQLKVPLTNYRERSYSTLQLADWSIATKAFGSERQIGMRIENSHLNQRWQYVLGIYTGQNARASHAVELERIYGESSINLSSFSNQRRLEDMHPEVGLRGTMHFGNRRDFWDLSLSTVWDIQPVYTRDLNARFAIESHLGFNGVEFLAIGYLGSFKNKNGETKLGLGGVLAEASYRFNPWASFATRFTIINRTSALNEDAISYGEEKIRLAPSDEIEDVTLKYGNLGLVDYQQELSLGLNLYALHDMIKATLDFSWIHWARIIDDYDDFHLRLLLQFTI